MKRYERSISDDYFYSSVGNGVMVTFTVFFTYFGILEIFTISVHCFCDFLKKGKTDLKSEVI